MVSTFVAFLCAGTFLEGEARYEHKEESQEEGAEDGGVLGCEGAAGDVAVCGGGDGDYEDCWGRVSKGKEGGGCGRAYRTAL